MFNSSDSIANEIKYKIQDYWYSTINLQPYNEENMENKINISKLLKDCPKGMELDCTMFDNLVFCEIDSEVQDYPIITQLPNGVQKWFTSDGRYELNPNAKCVIFPKGKTSWDGFHRPFKDGEVVAYGKLDGKESQIFIFKDKKENNTLSNCYLMLDGDELDIEEGAYYVTRIATEEEKQKLFNAIKAHGYKWNSETKTLEELIESKEDTDNRVVMSGIYFDRENYADEVELHLNNYEIEIRDGKTYAIFKNQKTETLNPKFKVGDRIKHKTNPGQGNEVTEIKDTHYILDYELALPFLCQDQYELITNKFDITSLKKVTQPKFKVGDIIQDIDSYKVKITKVNIEDECYAYESTNATGIGVIMFSKQDEWELVSDIKPKFKVGDRIKKDKDHISGIITNISDDGSYKVEYQGGGISYVSLEYQDEYELVSNKFDITTLIPFESRVLVRGADGDLWKPAIYGFSHPKGCYVVGGVYWKQYIPYEGNEQLLGTRNDFKTWE